MREGSVEVEGLESCGSVGQVWFGGGGGGSAQEVRVAWPWLCLFSQMVAVRGARKMDLVGSVEVVGCFGWTRTID